MRRFIFPIICLLISQASAAGVYRWVDENGRTHFGDRPADATAEVVELRLPERAKSSSGPLPLPAAPGSSLPPTMPERLEVQRRMLDAFEAERNEKKLAKAEAEKAEKERSRNCAYAKDTLKDYDKAAGIYEPLEDGGRRFFTEEEKQQAVARLQMKIKRWCK